MSITKQKPLALMTSHLTKDEIRRRIETEPQSANIEIIIPEHLQDENDRDKFTLFAIWLANIGIWDAIDGEELARYINAEKAYVAAEIDFQGALARKDYEEAERLHRIQDRAFKQTQACEKNLGIGAMNRCRIQLKQKKDEEDDGPPLI